MSASSRSEVYHNIDIIKDNIAVQSQVEVQHEFRLVKLAIEKAWFPSGTKSIQILSPPHTTTNDGAHIQLDTSHLTLLIKPGDKKAHLYLEPEDGTEATAATVLSSISFNSSTLPIVTRRPTLLQPVAMSPIGKPSPLSPATEMSILEDQIPTEPMSPSPPPLALPEPFSLVVVDDIRSIGTSVEVSRPNPISAENMFLEARRLSLPEPEPVIIESTLPTPTPAQMFLSDPKRIEPSSAPLPNTTFMRPTHRRVVSSLGGPAAPSLRHRRVASTGAEVAKRFSASSLLLDQLWLFGAACAQRWVGDGPQPVNPEPEEGVFREMALVVQKDRLWPPGENLTYAFMDKAATTYQTNQQQKVKDTVVEWQKYANIMFECIDDVEQATIRITFNLRGGSWSFVGTEVAEIAKDEPTMNLGWIYGDSTSPTDDEKGTILHEFGHTLGLLHETQSPDRAGKLTLKRDAVIDYYAEALRCTPEEVERQILNVYNLSDLSNYSEFDTTSVMMYFMPASLNEEGIRIPPNNELSTLDKAFMIINYPSEDKTSFVDALQTTGVVGDSKDRILSFYDVMDFTNLRLEFNRYCAAARASQETPADPNPNQPPEITPPVSPTDPLLPNIPDIPGPPSNLPDPNNPPNIPNEPPKSPILPNDPPDIPTLPPSPTPTTPTPLPEPPLSPSPPDDTPTSPTNPTNPDSSHHEDPPMTKPTPDKPTDPSDQPDLPMVSIPDACASDTVMASRRLEANIRGGPSVYLWQPGREITYSWIQGSSQATEYRKRRFRETLNVYAERVNLFFREIAYDPRRPIADIHIYVGTPPRSLKAAGWAFCGTSTTAAKRTSAELTAWGGTVETSIMLSDEVLSKAEPTTAEARTREQRFLFHEIGHILGLHHEHGHCRVGASASGLFFLDADSIMLYPSPEGTLEAQWSDWKDRFDVHSTKYIQRPSKMDMAVLGVLYPRAGGHVEDRFEKDLGDLGIPAAELARQRDLAFAYYGRAEFLTHLQALRSTVLQQLTLLSRAKATEPPPRPIRQRDIINPRAQYSNQPFLNELLKQLQVFFKPTSGQLFALQFPGRFLQQGLYAWDTNRARIGGQFAKPTVVNESEFRLVDQLYNVGTLIGSPNGLNLSIVYEQILNNLIPGIQPSQVNFAKHQAEIRQWLLKEVQATDWVKTLIASQSSGTNERAPPNSSSTTPVQPTPRFGIPNKLSDADKVNRLELSNALTQEYLSAKQAWELEQQDMVKSSYGGDLDAVARRITRLAPIREAQLAAKHADAVVRGYSHLIRQYTAYMDIKTPSEMLQDAKDALREAATSSLDGTLKVYPVQLQPIDWFQSLSSNFRVQDLTEDPSIYLGQINSKSKQLDNLIARLASLSSRPRLSLPDLQDAVEIARDSLDRANAVLTSTYSANVISLAKTCINPNNEFVMMDFVSCAKTSRIPESSFMDIQKSMQHLADAQVNVQKTSRTFTQALASKSLADAISAVQETTEIKEQIRCLTQDISILTSRFQAILFSESAPGRAAQTSTPIPTISLDQIPLHPPRQDSENSRWQGFTFNHQIDTLYSSSSDKSGASTYDATTSLFFGSHDSENQEAAVSSMNVSDLSSVEVEVGFRASLVTIDRSGWFQPQFFKQSAGFHCLDKHVSWSKWPKNLKSVGDLGGMGKLSPSEATTTCAELNKYLLPAFPVGFVICKDITIKIHISSSDIHKSSAEIAAFAATSAGVLCFSTSSSDTLGISSRSYGFQSVSDGCVIRIPGPQILGYMLQFLDPDKTTEVPENLMDGFLVSDADYNFSFT